MLINNTIYVFPLEREIEIKCKHGNFHKLDGNLSLGYGDGQIM